MSSSRSLMSFNHNLILSLLNSKCVSTCWCGSRCSPSTVLLSAARQSESWGVWTWNLIWATVSDWVQTLMLAKWAELWHYLSLANDSVQNIQQLLICSLCWRLYLQLKMANMAGSRPLQLSLININSAITYSLSWSGHPGVVYYISEKE